MSKIIEILDKFDINGHSRPGGTDKNSTHSYVDVYDLILSKYLDKKGSLLEIGIQYGGSILLWQELLKNFKICGVDTTNQIHPIIQSQFDQSRVRLEFCDAYWIETCNNLKSYYPNGFDVIIDDGPHSLKHQIDCINLYTELLKVNGVLIIEDIQNFEDVDSLKQSIPLSDVYDYHFEVHDLRYKKNRYDDVMVTITKKEKIPENKIAVFYHLGQFGQWQRLYQEQMNSLVISGLYEQADHIHIGVNGDNQLPFTLPKFNVVYNNNKILEADTIKALYDFCIDHNDYKVLYFHSKGSTQEDKSFRLNVEGWRLYLEYFTIHQWKESTTLLNQYDTAGTEYSFETGLVNQETGNTDWETNPHYAGNFWWANASYIIKLDPSYLYRTDKGWDRYRSEFWIGTGDPKYYNFYHTSIFSKYSEWGVTPLDYVKKNLKRKNQD